MTTTDPNKLKAKAQRHYESQKARGVLAAKAQRHYESQKARGVLAAKDRRKHERTAMARPFIAWDGEGVTVCRDCRNPWPDKPPEGYVCEWCHACQTSEHVYLLLRNSTGTYVTGSARQPLPSPVCVNFILHTAFLHPGAIHVAYAFDYDVNMILANLPEDEVRAVHEYEGNAGVYVRHAGAVVNYHPHKMVRLSRTIGGKRHSCTIFDLFTFEHSSFVKACDRYLGKEWAHRDEVIAGKERRAQFTQGDLAMMTEYCGYELDAMVLLANELRERLNDAGLRPATWNGPGAVASRVLQKYSIKTHIERNVPEVIQKASAYAYSGGRFELFRFGAMNEPIWRYDIHSAYPWAMTLLPSLKGGRWIHVRTVHDIIPNSLYHVYWRSRQATGTRLQPFHHRHENGNVCFPMETEGWYWAPEVEAALEYARRDGFCDIEIREAYLFEPASETLPFDFMGEYYNLRRELKQKGHPSELAYKLAINSVYGKLIQQIGWRREPRPGETPAPAWFSLQWGGLITSYTRARLMSAVFADQGLDDLISFETDAVFTRKRYTNAIVGEELGEWEETALTSLTYLQSGFYAASDGSKAFGKMRGRSSLTQEAPEQFEAQLRECILERKPLTYTQHGFVGMGRALSTDFRTWRTWIDIPREVEPPDVLVETSSKRVHDVVNCSCDVESGGTMANRWHTTFVPPVLSAGQQRPYVIRWADRIQQEEIWND